jgi:hypothetical protein
MMDNIFIRQDPAGNIKADKEKSTKKIDSAIATNLTRVCIIPEVYFLSDTCIYYLKCGKIIRGKLMRDLTIP